MRDANYFQKLYYHRLGTAQSEDKLIYERADNKEMGFAGSVTMMATNLLLMCGKELRRRTDFISKISLSRIRRS